MCWRFGITRHLLSNPKAVWYCCMGLQPVAAACTAWAGRSPGQAIQPMRWMCAAMEIPAPRDKLPMSASWKMTWAILWGLWHRERRPRPDFRHTIASMEQPVRLLAGRQDEVFHSDRFESVFQEAGNPVPVSCSRGFIMWG